MSRTPTRKFRALHLVPVAVLAAVASFAVGMRTAGDLQTVQWSSADDGTLQGDVNADGTVDVADAIAILEIAQKYRVPTVRELEADPNGNGALTVDDAIRVLRSLSR
jgi:hypothetical protein